MTNKSPRAGPLLAFALAALPGIGPGPVSAQIDPDDLLPVDEAFALSTELTAEPAEARLRWDIAEGYYLYRHAFKVEPTGSEARLGPPRIPSGKSYSDEFFGDVEIYRDAIEVVVPVETLPANGPLRLRLSYQGCADLGVCYPPQRREIELARPPAPVASGPAPGRSLLEGFGTDRELTGRGEPLPPEEAFRVEAIAVGPDRLLARFTAHPGYYLYRHTIGFETATDGYAVAGMDLPGATPLTDEYFGETQVYFDQVEIPVMLERPPGPATDLALTASFQGCQDEGICYPPMTRSIEVSLPAAATGSGPAAASGAAESPADQGPATNAAADTPAAPVSEQNRLARMIAEQSLGVTILVFVLLGIGLAFTPCVFPMIPILSGIIAGEGEDITRARAFALSLVYVLAMALTYTAVGVIAALAGYNLQAAFQNPWILGAFAAIFVLLSLAMFGFYNLQMPAAWQARLTEISNRQSGGNLIGAGIMGFLSALIVGPCVTAPLIGILIFISQTGDAVLGGSVLFALSVGMGLPLLAIGIGLGHWLPRAGPWMDAVKAVFGVGLLALAVWMLERILPGGVTMLLWGALAIGSGVYLGALTRLGPDARGWAKLRQAMGVMLLIFGAAQFAGSFGGGRDWLRPLEPYTGGGSARAALAEPQFTEVSDLEQLERALAAAQRPVMLDFYADWCVDCKRMERRTFPQPEVARAMSGFDLLKIDMTDFNDAHQRVLNEFGLHGPPAYLFFADGRELEDYRMFGFMAPEQFVAHLGRVRESAR